MTTQPGIPVNGALAPPTWWATSIVGLAAAVLPGAEHRRRYRQEFRAELYGMAHAEQARHTRQVLSRAWALRSALRERELPIGDDGKIVGFWGRLACRLGMHDWRWHSTEDGSRYQRCTKCGTDRGVPGDMLPYPFI